MKKVAYIFLIIHLFSVHSLWLYPPDEHGILSVPPYLEQRERAQQTEKALCALLDVNGPEEFEQIVALISRCKPVVVMVYKKGNNDEQSARDALLGASKTFKGSVACAVMECGKDSDNHDVLAHILLHAKVNHLATPAFLFFKDAGLYAIDGSPAIVQGRCTQENLVKFIQTKFFADSDHDCNVCSCDFTHTPRGGD
ncbi:MAG: hypothetical protein WCW33_03565 [Candidatus Babeliales bacterium]|jgi:hypothetical protein